MIYLVLLVLAWGENPVSPANSSDLFVDDAGRSGLDFVHFNGMSGRFYYPEINGSGAAFFDYDRDGDMDIYLVQGGLLGPYSNLDQTSAKSRQPLPPMDRLYRNDMANRGDGSNLLRFTDVTPNSGLRATGFGFGVASGDYNRDGYPDLYITNFGANQFWRNNGDGSFTDVTQETQTGDSRWSMSAAFFDYDRDGHLDLFVTNYLLYDFAIHKNCITSIGYQDYCGPDSYDDARDRLYRNLGDGRFEDVTLKAGLYKEFGAGMGVVAADLNGDRWLDLYVANDADQNLLWINQKNGTFVNEALFAGCALDENGNKEAGMGVDVGDVNGDGFDDLFVTHLATETHTLYLNDGKGNFRDVTVPAGLAIPSRDATGWGTHWLDFDNDGWLDLFVANGAVKALLELTRKKDPFPFHQPNQLFRNLGDLTFADVSSQAGKAFGLSEVSRGSAVGDVDNDGDSDILILNNNGPVRLLLNQRGSAKSWLGIRLVDDSSKGDVTGARLCLQRVGQLDLWRRVGTDGGYLSSRDPRVIFGLGEHAAVKRLVVHWSDGLSESWTDLKPGRYHALTRGDGTKQVAEGR